jgi:O-methyltransferase involved in polyketide biosynthesis
MISAVPPRRGSDAVSPTAHYTGQTWVRNGLSAPGLATWEGRVMFDALRPTMALSRLLGGPTLEGLLLARHRIIDSRLEVAIESGRVGQVLEVACGMSPRGWRFAQRHGDQLTYVEADLPGMAERKRSALAEMNSLSDHHRVVELDVFRDGGPGSLDAALATLDPERGTAIITEGLLTYFDDDAVIATWGRFAAGLAKFPSGLYLADLRLAGTSRDRVEQVFNVALSGFVRGKVHPHFLDEAEAAATLEAAGFDEARVHRGNTHPAAADVSGDPGAALIRVVEGTTQPDSDAAKSRE